MKIKKITISKTDYNRMEENFYTEVIVEDEMKFKHNYFFHLTPGNELKSLGGNRLNVTRTKMISKYIQEEIKLNYEVLKLEYKEEIENLFNINFKNIKITKEIEIERSELVFKFEYGNKKYLIEYFDFKEEYEVYIKFFKENGVSFQYSLNHEECITIKNKLKDIKKYRFLLLF